MSEHDANKALADAAAEQARWLEVLKPLPPRKPVEPVVRYTWSLIIAWAVVYGAALGVLFMDLFFWRP